MPVADVLDHNFTGITVSKSMKQRAFFGFILISLASELGREIEMRTSVDHGDFLIPPQGKIKTVDCNALRKKFGKKQAPGFHSGSKNAKDGRILRPRRFSSAGMALSTAYSLW